MPDAHERASAAAHMRPLTTLRRRRSAPLRSVNFALFQLSEGSRPAGGDLGLTEELEEPVVDLSWPLQVEEVAAVLDDLHQNMYQLRFTCARSVASDGKGRSTGEHGHGKHSGPLVGREDRGGVRRRRPPVVTDDDPGLAVT